MSAFAVAMVKSSVPRGENSSSSVFEMAMTRASAQKPNTTARGRRLLNFGKFMDENTLAVKKGDKVGQSTIKIRADDDKVFGRLSIDARRRKSVR